MEDTLVYEARSGYQLIRELGISKSSVFNSLLDPSIKKNILKFYSFLIGPNFNTKINIIDLKTLKGLMKEKGINTKPKKPVLLILLRKVFTFLTHKIKLLNLLKTVEYQYL